MKNILIIGIGGTGSAAVDIFYQKKKELGNQTGNNITALVFDTDAGDLKRITAAKTVTMADSASVGTICDRIGTEYLREWFPCDDKAVRSQEMIRGASQWRKKSYLAFLNLMNKPLARNTFISALEQMTLDPSASCEVYVIASVAGGTGSGSFIPIALYAKRYLRKTLGKDPIINAMIALPDIYADAQTPENRIKVYSNAYAILRELNAINLVARNYNAGLAERKKAPIRFRIGDPREPNVGLLFDASDKQFWTPEAAPFSQVFLLDRIPGINSVTAHNMVLANSLYTILCTDIGSAFDSEFSNHELLRSQNNGSNAIYAGISTAQIRFPSETVLDYLAHKKTVDSCDMEWLTLHKAVENAIKEKERQAKAANRRYNMGDGEYASILLSQVEELEAKNSDAIVSILERSIYAYDEEGKRIEGSAASEFAKKMDKHVNSRIPKKSEYENAFDEKLIRTKQKLERDDVANLAKSLYSKTLEYYQECIETIKRSASSTADTFLTLDKKKQEFVDKDVSIVANLLQKKDNYIHPVAAMIQLCMLRVELSKRMPKKGSSKEWEDLKRRNVDDIPAALMKMPAEVVSDAEEIAAARGKSIYLDMGEDRFITMRTGSGADEYRDAGKTNMIADNNNIVGDAKLVLDKIFRGAQSQLRDKVYAAIARDVDTLIAKYRNFFKRFEKEKEDLVEQTKTAYRKDAGTVDSVINVFSSGADKDFIYKNLVEDGGPATDAEIAETDNIVGRGVFATVFNSAAAEFMQDTTWNDKDSGAFRSLFGDMVKGYRDSIRKSEDFEKIAAYNAVEAIVATCGERPDNKKISEAFKSCFSIAQDLATPSLRLDTNHGQSDLVQPSSVMVFMMSVGTGRYLKKHADEFGLQLPADQNKESDVIKACAEEFIRRYSGNNSARVSIVSSMPDQVLYCTGEIMDITPLRIAKFNELGNDNTYFKNYSIALANHKKYGTDMWNPHLGNNLHKRGCLPYMNEEKERESDVMVVKALLYAFQKGLVVYEKVGVGNSDVVYKYNGKPIEANGVRRINTKNVANLLAWLRNEDELVEAWSALFDKFIEDQMKGLPNLASDNSGEMQTLTGMLTGTPFMKMLTDTLYEDETLRQREGGKKPVLAADGKLSVTDRKGPTAIEFAYMVKTSEELGRDCDDAERILAVLYDTFKKLCDFRTNAESYPERFVHVYKQQLDKVFDAVACCRLVCAAGSGCETTFNQLAAWLNRSSVFNTIADSAPVDNQGKLCIDVAYDAECATGNSKKLLAYIKKGLKASIESN